MKSELNTNVMDCVFNTRPFLTELRKWKKTLKQQCITLKVKYEISKIQLTLYKADPAREILNCTFIMYIPPFNHCLNLEYYGLGTDGYQDIYGSLFDLAKRYATLLSMKLVVCDNDGSHLASSYGFVCANEFPGIDYPIGLLGSTLNENATGDKSVHELIYYYELEPGYVRKSTELVSEFLQATAEVQARDITFKNNGNYQNETYCGFDFYYDGFTGKVILYYEDLKVVLEKGAWLTSEFVEEWRLRGKEDVRKTVHLAVETAVESLGLIPLFNPPRRHFTDYVVSHFYAVHQFADHMFEALLSDYQAKEIETRILTEPVRSAISYENVYLFGVLHRYFVITKETVTMFPTHIEAIDYFEQVCTEMETKAFQEKLSLIQLKKRHAEEEFEIE